jgi:holliday junction DNA helicase RuvA
VISRLQGILLTRGMDRVEIETRGGVVYEVEVPTTVLQRLPQPGGTVELRTAQVVTETSTALYGFLEAHERTLFQRLRTASGVGAKVALGMMSAYGAERLARALVEKDLAALQQVKGIGKKMAEKIVLELADKVTDLAMVTPRGIGADAPNGAQEAVRALVALGYTFGEADKAVRGVLEEGAPDTTEDLIRRALAT